MDNKITGTVENIVYKNEERGFSVIDMDVAGEMVTVVGDLFGASVGEELTVWGEYTTHPSFGYQFKASACERVLPSSAAAIRKYLSGGAIEGVGPVTARRMVDAFGEETLDVIAKEPEKLTCIKGISLKKAREISDNFRRIYGVREAFRELSALGLETADALALYRAFSDAAVQIVTDNPYMLCGYPTYKDFAAVDGIAAGLGFAGEDKRRLRAGLIFVLRHNLNNGHTCVPVDTLIDRTYNFLQVTHDSVEIDLYDAVEEASLQLREMDGTEMVFLPDAYRAERYITERIQLLNALEYKSHIDADRRIEAFEKENGIEYEELQKRAIELALTKGAVVITGGPGTGKTTTLNAILALCEENGDKVRLAAPTGRAAKRLSELTGRQAKTIHRLLEVDYQGKSDSLKFIHDETNPLKCDVVVIDEMSMVDVSLFESLLRGIRPQCRLIMVGDFNQLPSVGAGNILRDIIESGVCETVEFRKIFRQAAKSLIVVNAHSIVAGERPDIDTKDRDFFFLRTPRENGAALIGDLIARRLPKSYKYDPFTDIQVLCPSRIGMMGTVALNDELRERLNPSAPDKNEARIFGRLFREGDRVMQIKNNYDIKWNREDGEDGVGMFNGDIGLVEHIDRRNGQMVCMFDDRRVNYTFEQCAQLEPAFAVTVHKSQGSEFPAVVLSLCDVSRKLCYRNLLYTAVTRAKELLVIVGDERTLDAMVENDRKTLRYTGLRAMLQGEII